MTVEYANHSILRGMNMSNAWLSQMRHANVDLSKTIFDRAIMHNSRFKNVSLVDTSLYLTDFESSVFINTDFAGANLWSADFTKCVFENCSFGGLIRIECPFPQSPEGLNDYTLWTSVLGGRVLKNRSQAHYSKRVFQHLREDNIDKWNAINYFEAVWNQYENYRKSIQAFPA